MSYKYTPGIRRGLSVVVGLAGGTGSGKTYSAMRLAAGLAGGKPFAVADSENDRALYYADDFKFDHTSIRPPFRPGAYMDAIVSADEAGYPVVLVDNVSHVWSGDGGCVDWHEEILTEIVERKRAFAEGKGWQFDEWKTREANNIGAWIEPKQAHKAFVEKLLQMKAHVVMCFRAASKIEMAKEKDEKTGKEKTVVRPTESPVARDGWVPICEKTLPYEMTTFLLLKAEHPGHPIPITLREPQRHLFPSDKPITEAAGEALARWASGADKVSAELQVVLKDISAATTLAQLEACAPAAGKLKDDDKKRAKEAYARKGGQLKA